MKYCITRNWHEAFIRQNMNGLISPRGGDRSCLDLSQMQQERSRKKVSIFSSNGVQHLKVVFILMVRLSHGNLNS